MRFERKIFFAIFALSSMVCTVSGLTIFRAVKEDIKVNFRERYQTLASTVSGTFNQMDRTSDRFIESSLRLVSQRFNGLHSLPSNKSLKELVKLSGLTSVDVIRRDGVFVRSSSFPEFGSHNLFSYCEGYHRVFPGTQTVIRTPIMPSSVFGKGIKFFLLALPGSKLAVNVGYQLDLIGETLSRALSSDSNIKTVGLYAPSGKMLGEYSNSGVSDTQKVATQDDLEITSRVKPTESYCCECARNGLTVNGGNDYYYVLRMTVSREHLNGAIRKLRMNTSAVLFIALLLSLAASKVIAHSLVSRLRLISVRATDIMTSKDVSDRIAIGGKDEVACLASHFDAMLESLETAQNERLRLEKGKTFAQIASQVSHDIRSPLTALQLLLGQISSLPEQQRTLARSAISRITDIANSLLDQSKQTRASLAPSEVRPTVTVELAPALMDCLISEARLKARALGSADLNFDFTGAYDAFIKIDSAQFKRAICNLLNNACEAVDGTGVRVHVTIKREGSEVIIMITDEGKGMPDYVLSQLGNEGVTFGKDKGSGLGVCYAKKTIEAAGGRLNITSRENLGTSVRISLPVAPTPAWFVQKIEIPESKILVSVDDDQAIHQVWSDRLEQLHFAAQGGRHLKFNSVKATISFFEQMPDDLRKSHIFLVDYEFGSERNMNGLDLIKQLNIADHAMLVTSRYEEASIRTECDRLGIKIIPKGMAPLVPIAMPALEYA